MQKKLLVIAVAGLSQSIQLKNLDFRFIGSVFPALTCPVQASFRTAALPCQHGMIANGLFHRTLKKAMFWEQSSALVQGSRIWDNFRKKGRRVAMLFWQQSLGEDVDVVLSPAPIHKHHGGMIESCYGKPEGLYEKLCTRLGRRFKLRHYWGPLASRKVGQWIVDATLALLGDADLSPDLCFTYLPTLDYDLQRNNPEDPRACSKAFHTLEIQLSTLVDGAMARGYEIVLFGDYRVAPVSEGVFPNRCLRDAGLMKTRSVDAMSYPDLFGSEAFALTDHEIAHVYVSSHRDIMRVKDLLATLSGVGSILDRAEQAEIGMDHQNGGELLMIAQEGKWFAYPWWSKRQEAPDFAKHVDIHSKPGYDPCELFFGWPPGSVSLDTDRVRGSHGRIGQGRAVAWACSFSFPFEPTDLIELARGVRLWLDEED